MGIANDFPSDEQIERMIDLMKKVNDRMEFGEFKNIVRDLSIATPDIPVNMVFTEKTDKPGEVVVIHFVATIQTSN